MKERMVIADKIALLDVVRAEFSRVVPVSDSGLRLDEVREHAALLMQRIQALGGVMLPSETVRPMPEAAGGVLPSSRGTSAAAVKD
jgi:hypothetical protein